MFTLVSLILLNAMVFAVALVADLGSLLKLVLDNPQLVAAALGLFAPAIIEAVKQPGLSPSRRRLLAYGVSGLIGLFTVISLGQFNLADLTSTILITIAASQATYAEVWKPTGAAEAIAEKTTIHGSATPR